MLRPEIRSFFGVSAKTVENSGRQWVGAASEQTALRGPDACSSHSAIRGYFSVGFGRASRILTVVPRLTARRQPSGLNDTAQHDCLSAPPKVSSSWPLEMSQIFAVPSRLAEASRRPSGLQATPTTTSECPRKMRIEFGHQDGVRISRTMISAIPAPRGSATHRSSGLQLSSPRIEPPTSLIERPTSLRRPLTGFQALSAVGKVSKESSPLFLLQPTRETPRFSWSL